MKKLAVFLFILFIPVIATGCQKYNPVGTLKVEEAKVKVYFSAELNSPIQYDQYKGRTPDPEKHRLVKYTLVLKNTGNKKKSFVIAEPILDPSFKKLVINSGPDDPMPIAPGYKVEKRIYYLTEGDPAKVERLAYQSKVRIVWEEGGKKWEKVVSVTPER